MSDQQNLAQQQELQRIHHDTFDGNEAEQVEEKNEGLKELADFKESLAIQSRGEVDLIFNLMKKRVPLSEGDLSALSSLSVAEVKRVREIFEKIELQGSSPDTPYSWDYVFVFNTGKDDEMYMPNKMDLIRKEAEETTGKANDKKDNFTDEQVQEKMKEWEEGMPQSKFFGQIIKDTIVRVQFSRLQTRVFKSEDGSKCFVYCGISEKDLKYWADRRDADLKIDAKGAVDVGNAMKFPLAMRTKNGQLPYQLWEYLYAEYSPQANPNIYVQHARCKDSDMKTVFDEKTRLRIIYECITADQGEGGAELAVGDLVKNKAHPLIACFPLHDQEKIDYFYNDWFSQLNICYWAWAPLQEIRDYFGEPVAFYFAFLSFYMKWLIWPMFAGVIFFAIQISGGSLRFNIKVLPLLGFFIIFWNVALVDYWARREAVLRQVWGMTGYNEKAVARPQFRGEWKPDSITGMYSEQFSFFSRLLRGIFVFSGLLLILAASIATVVAIFALKDNDPNSTQLKIILGVSNGVAITIFNILYKVVSDKGNDFENHRTQQDYENAMIIKSFFFKFVNSFFSLFYLGFIRPLYKTDYYYLRYYDEMCETNVGAYMQAWAADKYREDYSTNYECDSTKLGSDKDSCIYKIPTEYWAAVPNGWTSNSTSCYDGFSSTGSTTYAYFCEPLADCTEDIITSSTNEKVLNELFFQLISLFITALVIQNTLEVGVPLLVGYCKQKKREKEAGANNEELVDLPEAEAQAELAPYENTIEDMTELIVQFGYVTLFVMAFPLTPFLAFLNNVLEMKVDAYNLIKSSQRPHPIGSYGLGSWNSVMGFFSLIAVATNVALITFRTDLVIVTLGLDSGWKWIFVALVSVFLAIVVSLEKVLIPDVPQAVIDSVERQRRVESVLVKDATVEEYEDSPPGTGDEDDDGVFDFDPFSPLVNVESFPVVPQKDSCWNLPETQP